MECWPSHKKIPNLDFHQLIFETVSILLLLKLGQVLHLMNICYCCFFSDTFLIHFWKSLFNKKMPNFVSSAPKPYVNFLWTCSFLSKNLSDFVSLPWKLHNHNRRRYVKLYPNCVNGFSKTKQKLAFMSSKSIFPFMRGFMQEQTQYLPLSWTSLHY